MGTELIAPLIETTVAGSLAILLVLALRRPVRAMLGAGAAYALWSCVPVALVAVLLPRAAEVPSALPVAWQVLPEVAVVVAPVASPGIGWQLLLGPLWLAGVLASVAMLGWQQRRFRRALGPLQRRGDGLYQSDSASAGLPAVTGVLWPRILLPADFEQRYNQDQQVLVLQHERLHVRRGDLVANALAALLHCLFWFNPLLPWASRRFRLDQELACDEGVIARNPRARRQYGEAMLKTQFHEIPLPLGCHWQARHPLRERIDMLRRPTPTPLRWMAATFLALGLSASAGYAAWAAQPASAPGLAKEAGSGLFLLARQNSHDGIAGGGLLNQWVKAGEEAVSAVGSGDAQCKNTAVVEAGAEPGTALVRMRIEHGQPGEIVAAPVVVVDHGVPAAVEQRDPSGKLAYRSQFVVLPLAGSRESTERRMRELLQASGIGASTASGADRPAVISERLPPPRYPREAAQAGVTGEVMLIVSVAADGSVTDVEVERATPEGVFDAGTVEAARQWRFAPAVQNGKAVPGRVRVPVTFELDPPDEAGATEGTQA